MNNRCQVFTPSDIASYMLDVVGYCVTNHLYGKKVLENSCGEGNILEIIVQRYIESMAGTSPEIIKQGLEHDIVAYDVDDQCCQITKQRLDLITEKFHIPQVSWNVHRKDALTQNDDGQFDFVIGNPPYISYRTMDVETRANLRCRFATCQVGAFDYCYAFIEHSLAALKPQGKMIYLIPKDSLQETTQGRYLTGGVPPVRFSM